VRADLLALPGTKDDSVTRIGFANSTCGNQELARMVTFLCEIRSLLDWSQRNLSLPIQRWVDHELSIGLACSDVIGNFPPADLPSLD
jgi:hypothetical protein